MKSEEKLKILVTGNLGYVGPCVVKNLRSLYPNSIIIGYDLGLFLNCFTDFTKAQDTLLNQQIFGDIRNFEEKILDGIHTIIHLAAISNDPIGNEFSLATQKINYQASIDIAKAAKKAGVKNFIFASSCSVYGAGSDNLRNETDSVDPLTEYAKSKVKVEEYIYKLANNNFLVTCFRFATACGWSQRFRFDLVLNDFVASAFTDSKIEILSDGKPWRPLINVEDMARAIGWAVKRENSLGNYLLLNCGSNEWNFRIADLAKQISETRNDIEVIIASSATPDKRSYAVDFSKFKQLAPSAYPLKTLVETVDNIWSGLSKLEGLTKNYRESKFVRLAHIKQLRMNNLLNQNLEWTNGV